jgi:class 3 adenylate cyclase
MTDGPPIRYAQSSDGFLAYQVVGEGPIDLLRIDDVTMTSIDSIADEPHRERFDRRLASFARVIRFDRRGIGMSDGVSPAAPLTIEQAAKDASAVLDAAASHNAAVFGGQTAMMFCAMYPERSTHLVLLNAFARLTRASDYPWGPTQAEVDVWTSSVPDPTHAGDGPDDLAMMAPSLARDPQFRAYWRQAGQRGASPAVARAQMEMMFESDIRTTLTQITVPTLVMHRPDNTLIVAQHSRYLAEHIAGARYVELPGTDYLFYGDNADAVVDEIEEFLTGTRGGSVERVLATVLFTDVVQSTERLVAVGDRDWRMILDRHDALVRAELARFRGREVNTAGDGFFAVFDSPAGALRCAQAIVEAARALAIEVRAGVHTGECEVRGDDYGGIAVHVGARVAALAGASEVLTTSTVKDLVAGSGIAFSDVGYHDLKGVPEAWHLYRVG